MNGLAQLAINSPISYLVALLLPAFDALIPVLPSETAIITLGVATAGSTDPLIAVLVLLAAFGAFLGDNAAYYVGQRLGPWINRRVFAGEKGQRRRAWAERALDRYGARIIIVCRFIPGGRTAVTLTCGMIGYSRRTFVAATAVAGVIWACYAFFVGRLGGQAFEDRPWAGLLLAFAAALVISALVELARRLHLFRGLAVLGRRLAAFWRGLRGQGDGGEPEGVESLEHASDGREPGLAEADPDRPEPEPAANQATHVRPEASQDTAA
jgi:membrane-associated protein